MRGPADNEKYAVCVPMSFLFFVQTPGSWFTGLLVYWFLVWLHTEEAMHAPHNSEPSKSRSTPKKHTRRRMSKSYWSTEKCEACGRTFPTLHGLHVHQGRWCDLFKRLDNQDYEVEAGLVLESRGPTDDRFYFLSLKGYGEEENCWVPGRWCEFHNLVEQFASRKIYASC